MKSKLSLIAAIILSVLSVLSVILFLSRNELFPLEKPGFVPDESDFVLTEAPTEPLTEKLPYKSPIDFKTLWETNTDIYAWIKIDNTPISYPIAQSETDDAYYLKHTIEGYYSDYGTLFTEHAYNKKDFSDRVTIMYGHYFPYSDQMFSLFQTMYPSEDAFTKYEDVVIYLPEKELHYKVFAAVPVMGYHLMYRYNNFRKNMLLLSFLNDIKDVDLYGTNYNPKLKIGEEVTEKDKILIMSTCYDGHDDMRYLVMAKLVSEID